MERRHTHEKHELQQLVFVGLDMLMEHKQQLHNMYGKILKTRTNGFHRTAMFAHM